MNDTIKLEDGVADFVEQVRARLADLSVDERAELTDGLEADLAEQVAERGPSVLGDPATYAAELRAAAGFSPVMGKIRERRELSAAVHAALDSAHDSWNRLLDALPQSPRPFLESIRPAWWIVRAWVAWAFAQSITGSELRYDLPRLLFFVVLVIGSVQLGRGAWGLGTWTRRSVVARLLLVVLNSFALFFSVQAVQATRYGIEDALIEDRFQGVAIDDDGNMTATAVSPLVNDAGEPVLNIYPYDANGQPLTGVQLFDQTGKPISLGGEGFCCYPEGTASYPWLSNGEAKFNVFPQPMGKGDFDGRRLPDAWMSSTPPSIALPPIESAPKVGLPTDAATATTAPAEPTKAP